MDFKNITHAHKEMQIGHQSRLVMGTTELLLTETPVDDFGNKYMQLDVVNIMHKNINVFFGLNKEESRAFIMQLIDSHQKIFKEGIKVTPKTLEETPK